MSGVLVHQLRLLDRPLSTKEEQHALVREVLQLGHDRPPADRATEEERVVVAIVALMFAGYQLLVVRGSEELELPYVARWKVQRRRSVTVSRHSVQYISRSDSPDEVSERVIVQVMFSLLRMKHVEPVPDLFVVICQQALALTDPVQRLTYLVEQTVSEVDTVRHSERRAV